MTADPRHTIIIFQAPLLPLLHLLNLLLQLPYVLHRLFPLLFSPFFNSFFSFSHFFFQLILVKVPGILLFLVLLVILVLFLLLGAVPTFCFLFGPRPILRLLAFAARAGGPGSPAPASAP